MRRKAAGAVSIGERKFEHAPDTDDADGSFRTTVYEPFADVEADEDDNVA